MLKRSITISACALAACTAALLLAPKPAHACGGLFCSTAPVDQNAERILFEVHPGGAVTATVEISYTGDPAEFSWIVPVPETPDHMAVAPVSALRLLDQATGPRIISPPTTCTEPFGFRNFDDAVPAPSANESDAGGGVTVEDLPIVGPYNPQVISADDPDLLVAWLEDNNYTITDEMKPLIAEYVGTGFKFLGVKLVPDAGVADIAPLSFTCPNPEGPFIPLKLTAVASEPEMGVMVFVAASQRYASQNYRMLTVPTDQVQMDPRTGISNYYPLVSWLVDQEGSTAFVTEFAAPSSEALSAAQSTFLPVADIEESMEWINQVLGTHPYLTRMYTRISGWEMVDDPVFGAFATGGNVSNVHDLSGRPAVEICGDNGGGSVPCGQTYCGVNQRCATTESGADACLCDQGFVARAITAPRGQGVGLGTTVTCQDASLDMLQSLQGQLDACAGNSCGEGGRCMPVNGFATCECDAGFAARVDFSGPGGRGLRCESVRQIYAPDQLLWPNGANERAPDCACAGVPASGSLAGLAGVLLGLGLAFRRRRR